MRLFTKYHQRLRITFIKCALIAIVFALLFLPHYIKIKFSGNNTYMVVLNGVECGTVDSAEQADEYIREARRRIACQSDSLVFVDTKLQLVGSHMMFGRLDESKKVISSLTQVLENDIKETMQHAYTVKVNEITVNLSSTSEVEALLNQAIDKYDTSNEYGVNLALDPKRELNVLATQIQTTREVQEQAEAEAVLPRYAGVEKTMEDIVAASQEKDEKGFEDYQYGIIDMGFAEKIEVVEAYLPQSEITDLDTAIHLLTEEQEQQQIYEVQSGDTLSEISMNVNIPLDDIIAMNDSLVSENSTIFIGQELVITVPVPELSVVWQEEAYYEESYEADIIYVDNDSWYTTESQVLQEPVAGFRKVVAIKTYNNTDVTDTNIIKEEVVVEAVPKIVERGTIIPPTYIKPISGGRITSSFGYRNISLKGATKYHAGVDWGTPIGTTVVASSAGKVTKAGWASGYGYVIYIKHSDGKETRYGHLSKIYVKVGQYVSQGEKIALSGNSGRSTGPHLHFEIIVNGTPRNPFNYIS